MPSIARKITQFSKREIDYLFKNARRVLRHSAFIILSAPRQLDFSRVLIITSRKVGNAPERNKIRRRIKSIFYEETLFNSSCDYAIIVHKKAVELSFDEIKKILVGVCRDVTSQ